MKDGTTTKLREIELFFTNDCSFFNITHRERLFLNKIQVTQNKKSEDYTSFKEFEKE